MLKINNKILLIMPLVLVVSACKTVDVEVEKLVHTRTAPANTINPYKAEFTKNIQGSYVLIDNTPLQIDGSGHFKLGEVEYFLQDALSKYQGVYVAATPVPNSSKKVYTYHGIVYTPTKLLNVPYKEPSFENKVALTEKDTDFSWEVNLFQPENINWQSGFMSPFAFKQEFANKELLKLKQNNTTL